jgi:PAS domain S-box-containing protein
MRMGADRRVTQASAGAGYQSIQVAPSQWYFNEGALNRYGIARSNLPEDAVIVGEPGSLIDRHPVSFALAFVGVAAQTALIVYLLLNIRKRREITFTLRQREEQLQRLIEHSPMAACITDAESRIVYINQRHFQTFGYTLEEIDEPEKAARRFFPDAHERAKVLEDWKTEFERAQNEGRDPAPQVRNITCKDGRTLVVEFYYTLIGKQGFGILIDITERTRAVAELERVSKAAQAASEAKSQFLANVSHEIRTPMNGVLGMAQLLLETDPTPDQREYIDTIRDSSHLLLTIINDLLDLSKIEAGQMALDQRPVDTRTFIEGIAGLVESNMQQKGLDFAVELEHTVPQAFRCDPNRLSQVLLNLLNNALKFTDAGLVRLYVSSRDLGRYRGELMFRVVDSGIGIAPEQLERIFLPFNQGDTSTTRKYGGTGLGLTISRRLVEMMGGKLSVVSTPGKGSEFRFTIQVDIVPAVAAVKLEERIDGNLSHRYPLRILVAEDNPVNQKVALMVLQKMGYAADLAGNGVEAIEKLREHRYDVVLMDVQMPVMDGLTAVRKIRCEFPRDRQPQVIALTAHAMNDDIQRCREAGMDGYLSKPLRVPKLGEALVKAYEALVPMA